MATQTDPTGTNIAEQYDLSNATKPAVYALVSVTTTATSLASLLSAAGAAAIPTWPNAMAFLTPESAVGALAVRYRCDGVAPVGGVWGSGGGQPIFGGQSWPLQGLPDLGALQLISATGATVPLSVEFRG